MDRPRLDLHSIATVLREARQPQRLPASERARDPLDERTVSNMLAGYAYVDWLVAEHIDLFAMGHHRHLLELNSLALCGADEAARAEYRTHLAATERRFYEEPHGGVEDLVEWYRIHAGLTLWERAAGVYLRILNEPQLFIEGNHRTGALVMSYLLVREGEPPFVLSAGNAAAFFAPSAVVREIRKHSVAALVRVPWLRRRLAQMLIRETNRGFLLPQSAQPALPHPVATAH